MNMLSIETRMPRCLSHMLIIYVKKLQFIHIVNGDGSKTAKIIKRTINHTN